jgi:hypothetical protein
MGEEAQGSQDKTTERLFWTEVLAAVSARLPAAAVDTWFRPVRFVACRDSELRLAVPTETFRARFQEHYAARLGEIVDEIAGKHLELRVAVCDAHVPSHAMETLPVAHASELDKGNGTAGWLIERLWTAGGVGILAGQPKSLKTYVALEMAVSVASGSPCLGTFPVSVQGPSLVYAAEDSPSNLRSRLESLSAQRNLRLENLDLRVITSDFIRLDHPQDQKRLHETLLLYRPALLVLDPLVRLHCQDENQAGPMAALLGYLRHLQRLTGTAVLVVHHLRKGGNTSGTGYNLRGSSDLYAWVDSFVSLQRRHDRVTISAEHRAASPLPPLPIELVQSAEKSQAPWLRIRSQELEPLESDQDRLRLRLLDVLRDAQRPLKTEELRQQLQVRKQRVTTMLQDLCEEGSVVRLSGGYRAAPDHKGQNPSSAP